jgi:AcrR family transcriptional regulator
MTPNGIEAGAAKEAFTRSGANASLDEIAKEAGVGAGTPYRHFPTRDALIEAVYRTEVEKLATAERRFAAAIFPIEALRAWMLIRRFHCDEADHHPCIECIRRRPLEAI